MSFVRRPSSWSSVIGGSGTSCVGLVQPVRNEHILVWFYISWSSVNSYSAPDGRNIYSCNGLPLVTLGVYPPGKLRVDNCFACPSTTAASMYSVAFVSIAGANWSSSVNFIFYFFSQNSRSSSNSSNMFPLCQSYLPTREFFKTPQAGRWHLLYFYIPST